MQALYYIEETAALDKKSEEQLMKKIALCQEFYKTEEQSLLNAINRGFTLKKN